MDQDLAERLVGTELKDSLFPQLPDARHPTHFSSCSAPIASQGRVYTGIGDTVLISDLRRILVFGAHPDDEIAGPGGTIAEFSSRGVDVRVVTFTAGATGYARKELKEGLAAKRLQESAASDRLLGVRLHTNLGKPSQGIQNDKDTYLQCVAVIRKAKPDAIFSHFHQDKHRDHRAVSRVVDEARWMAGEDDLRELGSPWQTQSLYYYETTELFANPSLLIDISRTFDRKLQAMKANASQLEVVPGVLDYLTGLAMVRGQQRGCRYAEAFLDSTFESSRC